MTCILVLDSETTGIDPNQGHRVVEIALVPLAKDGGSWRILKGASSLVAPGRTVPPEARAVHHLRDEDLRTAPHLPQAIDLVAKELNLPSQPIAAIAAHNAEFDHSFIGAYIDVHFQHAFSTKPQWLCTWRLAQHLWPDAPAYSNQVLRYWLPGVDEQVRGLTETPPPVVLQATEIGDGFVIENHTGGAISFEPRGGALVQITPQPMAPHRALYDAYTTACILQRMLALKPLDELLALQSRPILQKTIRFGKHKGRPWSDAKDDAVLKSYLQWLVSPQRKPPFAPDVLHTARHYLGAKNV